MSKGEITYHGGPLLPGMKFTIAGFGVGSRGQRVIDGFNPKTNRKCKAVRPIVFKVVETVGAETAKVKEVSGG